VTFDKRIFTNEDYGIARLTEIIFIISNYLGYVKLHSDVVALNSKQKYYTKALFTLATSRRAENDWRL